MIPMESNTVMSGPELPNALVCPETPPEVSPHRRIEPWEFEQMLQRATEILKLRASGKQVAPE